MAEELETHRLMAQQRALDNGTADAVAASRRAMGNVTLAREDARAQWIAPWLDSVWQDATYALRMFRRAPAFTGAFVLVMALGVGATTAVFALVDGLVLRDLPVSRPDRLVLLLPVVLLSGSHRGQGAAPGFSSLAAWSVEDEHAAWTQQFELRSADGIRRLLRHARRHGGRSARPRTPTTGSVAAQGRVAVISYPRGSGATAEILGRRTDRPCRSGHLHHRWRHAGGILRCGAGVAPEITIPLTSNARPSSLQSATSSWVHLIGRLREDVTLAQANTALRQFWPAVLEDSAGGRCLRTGAIRSSDARPRSSRRTPVSRASATASQGRCGSSLAWSRCCSWSRRRARPTCSSHGAAQRREIAVRLAIGAGRTRLVRQMLTESMVLTTIAAAAGW